MTAEEHRLATWAAAVTAYHLAFACALNSVVAFCPAAGGAKALVNIAVTACSKLPWPPALSESPSGQQFWRTNGSNSNQWVTRQADCCGGSSTVAHFCRFTPVYVILSIRNPKQDSSFNAVLYYQLLSRYVSELCLVVLWISSTSLS